MYDLKHVGGLLLPNPFVSGDPTMADQNPRKPQHES
jgi:hypothetical protein